MTETSALPLARPAGKIEMVDLRRQHARLQPALGEAMAEVLEQTVFINGPQVAAFAYGLSIYLHARHVIPCANGTDAIQLVLMALDLEPGAEVIVPAFNYVATAEVVALLGLTPVFCEVEGDTFSIDIASARAVITARTRVIMPVHLFGQCAPMEEVLALAKEHNLYVIEDTAQAIGAEYRMGSELVRAGTMGTAGTVSFFPSKNLGCMGDGGAVYLNDDALAERIRMMGNHGQRKKYTYELIGCNSRLDTLQAAILSVKLEHLPEFTAHRRWAATLYDELLADLPGIHIPVRASYSTHVYHQYTLRVEGGRREALKEHLAAAKVPTMIYYPSPLHLQPAFAFLGSGMGSFPVAERLCEEVISLPMHSEITEEEVRYIAANVRAFMDRGGS